jgi:hypothetical protein
VDRASSARSLGRNRVPRRNTRPERGSAGPSRGIRTSLQLLSLSSPGRSLSGAAGLSLPSQTGCRKWDIPFPTSSVCSALGPLPCSHPDFAPCAGSGPRRL